MNEGCVPGGSGIGQLIPSRISIRVCCSSDTDRFGLQAQCPLMRVARGSETRHIGVPLWAVANAEGHTEYQANSGGT